MHHETVAFTRIVEGSLQLWSRRVLPTGFVGEHLVQFLTIQLAFGVLIESRNADVANAFAVSSCCCGHGLSLLRSVRNDSGIAKSLCQEESIPMIIIKRFRSK